MRDRTDLTRDAGSSPRSLASPGSPPPSREILPHRRSSIANSTSPTSAPDPDPDPDLTTPASDSSELRLPLTLHLRLSTKSLDHLHLSSDPAFAQYSPDSRLPPAEQSPTSPEICHHSNPCWPTLSTSRFHPNTFGQGYHCHLLPVRLTLPVPPRSSLGHTLIDLQPDLRPAASSLGRTILS